MKKFNALMFIIKMLKVFSGLIVLLTIIITVALFGGLINGWNSYGWQVGWNFLGGQLLGIGVAATAGLVTAMLVYGVAELLDLLISIQENTYSSANVLRNMYRDQLNAQNVEAVHNNTDRLVRLRDVTPEGNVVEADLPMSNGSRR